MFFGPPSCCVHRKVVASSHALGQCGTLALNRPVALCQPLPSAYSPCAPAVSNAPARLRLHRFVAPAPSGLCGASYRRQMRLRTAARRRQGRRRQHRSSGISSQGHSSMRGLTPRSRRAPTAGHQAPATGTLYIFCARGLASHRRCRLTSNVRRRRNALFLHLHTYQQPQSTRWLLHCGSTGQDQATSRVGRARGPGWHQS